MRYTVDFSKFEGPFTLPEEEGARIMGELLAHFEGKKLSVFFETMSYVYNAAMEKKACLEIFMDEKEKTGSFTLTAKDFTTARSAYAKDALRMVLERTDLQIRTQNGLVVIEGKADLK